MRRALIGVSLALAVLASAMPAAAARPPHLAHAAQEAGARARAALAAAADAPARAEAWGELAMFHHGQQELAEAERLYGSALAELPAGARARARWLYLRAVVRRDRGDVDGAIADYRALLAVDSRHFLASYRLGAALIDGGDPAAAAEALRAALALEPDSAAVHAALADAAIDLGDWAAARDHAERAWAIEPAATALAYKLALVHRHLGDRAGAERWLERRGDVAPAIDDPDLLAVAAQSLNARFYLEAAALAERRGEVREALSAFDTAVRLAPADPAIGIARARALDRAGMADDALLEIRRVAALAPERARALRASLAMRAGRHAEAAAAYAALALGDGSAAEHPYWQAMALLADGDCRAARAPLARALALRPNAGEAHLVAARAEALCGDAGSARERAEVLRRVRDDADTRLTVAFAALAAGDAAAARRLAAAESPHPDADMLLAAIDAGRAPARPFAPASDWWRPPLPPP